MSQISKHFPRWAYIVLPMCVGVVAWSLIGHIARRADDFSDTRVELARIQGLIYQLRAIEKEATLTANPSVTKTHTAEQIRQQADAALADCGAAILTTRCWNERRPLFTPTMPHLTRSFSA